MNQIIYWDKQAFQSFSSELRRQRKRSFAHAAKTESEVLSMIDELAIKPIQHPLDKFKRNNTGRFRAFECNKQQVAYYVDEDRIIILRVLHWRRRGR